MDDKNSSALQGLNQNGGGNATASPTTNRSNNINLIDEDESSNTGIIDGGSIEQKCATKIQANIRGYLVRKHQKREQEAAVKIQASFRGFKARKDLQKKLKENN